MMRRNDRENPEPTSPRTSERNPLERVYGLNAAMAVHAVRPDEIVRIAHTPEVRRSVADLLRAAAARHARYNEVASSDLDRIAESTHHEGLCVFTRPRKWLDLPALTERVHRKVVQTALLLDHIGNPHNVGALLRTAGFLGVDAVVLVKMENQPLLPPSAVRIAEGAAERVQLVRVEHLADAIAALRSLGMSVVGADVRASQTHDTFRWTTPCALVVGNEREGLTPNVQRACSQLVRIRGREGVESLNVSVAGGVLMNAMLFQRTTA